MRVNYREPLYTWYNLAENGGDIIISIANFPNMQQLSFTEFPTFFTAKKKIISVVSFGGWIVNSSRNEKKKKRKKICIPLSPRLLVSFHPRHTFSRSTLYNPCRCFFFLRLQVLFPFYFCFSPLIFFPVSFRDN